MLELIKKKYESPCVEVIEIRVGQGVCATSTIPFEDGGEIQWDWE